MNKRMYSDLGINGSTAITGNTTISQSLVKPDRIDMVLLKASLFPEKKVLPQKPPTIDQMVTSALSRLHVSIEAEARWANLQISKDFDKLKKEHLTKYNSYVKCNNATVENGKRGCFMMKVECNLKNVH